MHPGLSIRDGAGLLATHRRALLEALCPAGRARGDKFMLGDPSGAAGNSFPVPLDPRKRSFTDFASGWHGDDVDLIANVRGCSIAEAMKFGLELLGLGGTAATFRPKPRPAKVAAPAAPKRPPTLPDALALWKRSQEITLDTPAGAYLIGRHCSLPHPEGDLRWLPDCRHPSGWRGPCLLALVTDPATGEPVTLHRTWIERDGSGKAPVDLPRLYWSGPKEHGVCRLWPDDEVTLGLLVAEGIETTLTAALGFAPAWSCLDAGGLAAFPHLLGIDFLTIVADHDSAGLRASTTCSSRWLAAGVETRIVSAPTPGDDLNDFAAKLVSGRAQ